MVEELLKVESAFAEKLTELRGDLDAFGQVLEEDSVELEKFQKHRELQVMVDAAGRIRKEPGIL